jgi:hypothetical protein
MRPRAIDANDFGDVLQVLAFARRHVRQWRP